MYTENAKNFILDYNYLFAISYTWNFGYPETAKKPRNQHCLIGKESPLKHYLGAITILLYALAHMKNSTWTKIQLIENYVYVIGKTCVSLKKSTFIDSVNQCWET